MVSRLRVLLEKQKELQDESVSLQHQIDCEVQRNVFDYLNKATKRHGKDFVASVITGYLNGEEPEAVDEALDQPKTIDDLLLRLFPDRRTGMEKEPFAEAYQEFAGNRRWSGLLKAGKVRTKNGKVYRCRG